MNRLISVVVVSVACASACSDAGGGTPPPAPAASVGAGAGASSLPASSAGVSGGVSAAGSVAASAGNAGRTVAAGSGGVPVGAAGASADDGDASVADAGGPADAAVEEPKFADCFESMPAAEGGSAATPYPGGRWKVPEPTFGTEIERDVRIEMSDGAVLVGDVSYPTDLTTNRRAPGPFPVLLTLNPYGNGSFGAQYGEIFVTHGYIFASVDVRGTSRSNGGPQELFSPRDALDGAELVTWVTKLTGADGRVGLQGCSQLGINQLETASQLGPNSPVKAMIPACPSGDFYRDTAFDNGIPSITANFLVPDAAMGDDTAYYRDYWRVRDRVARAPTIARADIPLLLWSGWHEPGALGSLDLYTVLQNVAAGRPEHAPIVAGQSVSGKYQVIIGDWGHGGGLDLGIQLQFYDTWIKGLDTGLAKDTATPLHIEELGGKKRWINARCYPLVQRYTPFYLGAGGKLARTADSTAAEDELRWVQQEVTSEPLEYMSEPFAQGAMIAGPLSAQLQVTSSNSNVQLFVEVFDRTANAELESIGFGSILGSLRQTDPDKSWSDEGGLPTRPYLALDKDQPLTPNERTQLVVPLGPAVRSIEPGHSLLVRISSHPPNDRCIGVIVPPVGCYPTQPMLSTLRGGTYKVQRGTDKGSLFSLPVLEHGSFRSIKTAVSPTGYEVSPLPVEW